MSAAPILDLAGKPWPLKWSLGARYRLQGLPVPITLADLSGSRSMRAVLDIGWAMLPPGNPWPTPETLVASIEAEPGSFERLDEAVAAALVAAYPPKASPAEEAKKASTASSPAPASSSG